MMEHRPLQLPEPHNTSESVGSTGRQAAPSNVAEVWVKEPSTNSPTLTNHAASSAVLQNHAQPTSFKRQTSLPPTASTFGNGAQFSLTQHSAKRPCSLPIPSHSRSLCTNDAMKPSFDTKTKSTDCTIQTREIPVCYEKPLSNSTSQYPRLKPPTRRLIRICAGSTIASRFHSHRWIAMRPSDVVLSGRPQATHLAVMTRKPAKRMRWRLRCPVCGCGVSSRFANRRVRQRIGRMSAHHAPFRSPSLLTSRLLSRVCLSCFDSLTKASTGNTKCPEATHSYSKSNYRSSIRCTSPEALASVSPTTRSSNSLARKSIEFDAADATVRKQQALSARCEPLIQFGPVGNEQSDVAWPPLVISTRAELSLQYDPPAGLLLSLLTTTMPPPQPGHGAELSSDSAGCAVHPEDRMPSDWIAPGITLALTRNVHLHIHPTDLRCCTNQPAWCFCSHGLDSLGQDEILCVVRRRPGELLPPLDVYRLYAEIYAHITGTANRKSPLPPSAPGDQTVSRIVLASRDAHVTDRSLFHPLDHFFPPNDRHSASFGFIFSRPAPQQCLRGLATPRTPFLLASLVHPAEYDSVRQLPMRLLLRLGKWARQYPTPLVSDRDRPCLFRGPAPALGIYDDSGQASCFGPAVIRLCTTSATWDSQSVWLELVLPNDLREALPSPDDCPRPIFIMGRFDPTADSHLVCVQEEQNSSRGQPKVRYHTEAISTTHTDRKVTGCSFALISPDSTTLHVSLVDDGLRISLSPAQFTQLLHRLHEGQPVQLRDDHVWTESAVATRLVVRWADQQTELDLVSVGNPSSYHTSWIDHQPIPDCATFLVPLHYQLAHWMCSGDAEPETRCNPLRLAWSKLHVGNSANLDRASMNRLLIASGSLVDKVAKAVIDALRPYVAELRASNQMRIGLRVGLQPPDQAGFRVVCLPHDVDGAQLTESELVPLVRGKMGNFSRQVEAALVPIVHSWVADFDGLAHLHQRSDPEDETSSSAPECNLTFDFDFNILD